MRLDKYDRDFLAKLESRAVKQDNGCWIWQGAVGGHKTGSRHQYPSVHYRGETARGNRIVYQLTYGEIPKGLLVCHSCDEPLCINPKHLFLGTQQHNMRDAALKGRVKVPGLKGEEHANAKFTDEEVIQLRKDYQQGKFTYRGKAEELGINRTTLGRLLSGATYSYLPLYPREDKYMNNRRKAND